MMVRILVGSTLALSLSTVAGRQSQTPPSVAAFSQWASFCEGVEYTAGIALGDFDGDGSLGYIAGATYGVAVGDVDRGGVVDIIVARDAGYASVVYRNDGKGNFTAIEALGREGRRALAVGDLDGDGDADAVLVGLEDHVFINEGNGRRWTRRMLGAAPVNAPARTGVALGDLDGDKDLDIVVPGKGAGASAVYLNDGKAGFAEARQFGSNADDSTSVAVGDIDRDGDLDVVTANWQQAHSVYLNDGRGTLTRLASFGVGDEQTWSVALADIDLDGDLDAVVGNMNLTQRAVDINGDGIDPGDLYVEERRDVPSCVYLNDGGGRFRSGPTVGTGADNTRPIALGDVDSDGDIDIVMGNDCQPNCVFFNSLRDANARPIR